MKTAVIIGASSGIGEALTKALVVQGYTVGICARRLDKLEALQKQLGVEYVHIRRMDVTRTEDVASTIQDFAKTMGHIDVVFNNAGIGFMADELNLKQELATIQTNISGFIAVALASYKLFQQQGYGHMVGISSIAALRGSSDAPAYFASKAAVSSYMEGLYLKSLKAKNSIAITDIRPGFVDTALAQGEGLFWVASPEVAAQQILAAMHKNRKVAYITKRWVWVAIALKLAPKRLLAKVL